MSTVDMGRVGFDSVDIDASARARGFEVEVDSEDCCICNYGKARWKSCSAGVCKQFVGQRQPGMMREHRPVGMLLLVKALL